MKLSLWGDTETKVLPDDTCEHPDERHSLKLVEEQPDGFKRVITIGGAHNCSKPRSDGSNHGIGSVRIWFLLVGPEGAVQWLINTGWFTRSTPPLPLNHPSLYHPSLYHLSPEAWDVGYHSRKPVYEEQPNMGACEYLDGELCYYDGSGLNAARFTPDFLTHPGAIWEVLAEEYDKRFQTVRVHP